MLLEIREWTTNNRYAPESTGKWPKSTRHRDPIIRKPRLNLHIPLEILVGI